MRMNENLQRIGSHHGVVLKDRMQADDDDVPL